ncbi:NAD-dependent epimerase/dehydratase family protein [Neptunicoccus sediminis]|uniref:NAD-dependent epimerase/dehydratase family protein n=1 Tax=Neptunicoccus sediminis TaxID=1892596 RepID=UPI000845E478|nr:NAD-dependent epimerase/dehydratase family protein [Neptunicoccus sediminis]
MSKTVLILGASGRFGRGMAVAFERKGWRIRRFDRKRDNLAEAASGVDIIVHGWNPPYHRWAKDMPKQTRKVIAAARNSGATVLLAGNVYVYGVDAPEVFSSDTPHQAKNPMGRLRIEMEQAFEESGAPTIILRAGDFLDTRASGNWFDMIISKPVAKGRIAYPGPLEIPRAWAYLPDFCRAFVDLAEKREELPEFTSLNFEGYTLSGQEIAQILGVKTGRFNWLQIYALAPFWPLARRILEMRYIWNKPHRIDGGAFQKIMPDFVSTPAGEALHRAASVNIDPDKPVVRADATV